MLPSENRLKLNKAKSYKWQQKKQVYTPLFRLIYRKSPDCLNPKIGFLVPGKIKGAVKRNRIRRLLTEAVGGKMEKFPKNIEAVFIADKKAEGASYADVNDWISKIIPKINITDN